MYFILLGIRSELTITKNWCTMEIRKQQRGNENESDNKVCKRFEDGRQ